jgi:hypothetical protein
LISIGVLLIPSNFKCTAHDAKTISTYCRQSVGNLASMDEEVDIPSQQPSAQGDPQVAAVDQANPQWLPLGVFEANAGATETAGQWIVKSIIYTYVSIEEI